MEGFVSHMEMHRRLQGPSQGLSRGLASHGLTQASLELVIVGFTAVASARLLLNAAGWRRRRMAEPATVRRSTDRWPTDSRAT
jgi:hypothetical protein